jgi:hypothetical protein
MSELYEIVFVSTFIEGEGKAPEIPLGVMPLEKATIVCAMIDLAWETFGGYIPVLDCEPVKIPPFLLPILEHLEGGDVCCKLNGELKGWFTDKWEML